MHYVSAAEALATVESRQRVYVHGGAATPTPLLEALAARGPQLRDVETVSLHLEGPVSHVAPELAGHIRHNALFIGANVRRAVTEGRADFTPVFLSDIPQLFANGVLPIDVALIQTTPPDAHGYCSLGVSVDVAQAAVAHAGLVIAEINERMPRSLGDSFVHTSRIDFAVATDRELVESSEPALDDRYATIGRSVASLIEDGTTLQLGIGAVADAVLLQLFSHRDLGIHTEMFSDRVVDLVEAGVITGARKRVHRGQIVSSFVQGTRRLFDFIDDNPFVSMHPSDYTNDPGVIASHVEMVAVNSAIEVDVTGQVCADSIGGQFYSGIGGQLDFIRGAARAAQGRPIIALPSTTADGKISRIVARLRPGAGVVTTRGDVYFIVTEYGIAALHGRTVRERAQALLEVAHPSFREQLARDASETFGLRLKVR